MELQLLQLEVILYAFRRQDNFQLVLSHFLLEVQCFICVLLLRQSQNK